MSVTIHCLIDSQIDSAKAVVIAGCIEFFGHPPLVFGDMDQISNQYTEPAGTFLVLLDDDLVVGTGAIRRLDDQTCELKRMWFLPNYRGKGHGTKMCELLFAFARSAGYRRVWLDTVPELVAANKLYHRLGFQPIDRYNDGPGTIFLQKML
jgi:putative acetyltransferase